MLRLGIDLPARPAPRPPPPGPGPLAGLAGPLKRELEKDAQGGQQDDDGEHSLHRAMVPWLIRTEPRSILTARTSDGLGPEPSIRTEPRQGEETGRTTTGPVRAGRVGRAMGRWYCPSPGAVRQFRL